jgi:hypothetical protein
MGLAFVVEHTSDLGEWDEKEQDDEQAHEAGDSEVHPLDVFETLVIFD